MSSNCDVNVFFSIYGKLSPVGKPGSGRMVIKPKFSLTITFHLAELENSYVIIALNKGTISAKKCRFFTKKKEKNADVKGVLVLKGLFSEATYVRVLSYQILSFKHNVNEF